MSPGSSSHSSSGSNRCKMRSGNPSTKASSSPRAMRQRRWPWTCSRKTSYESRCGPTPPPSLAQDIIKSSSRASGTKRKRDRSSCAASTCRSSPCTSSVQFGVAMVGKLRRGKGPSRTDHCAPTRRTSRDSTSAQPANSNNAARCSGATTPGIAWRISNGLLCQYSRMNWTGLKPPNIAIG